ncbi:hypothetical protein E2C01_036280 [Portunus trituberculatus]|uniref:Uncharacterized protein n=1 Tax=Portunus trituberculatus TaxID=210409 RepID=A0A5B7FC11_PORTR|nr:hypothetical protein [Portunus trituberculatus]
MKFRGSPLEFRSAGERVKTRRTSPGSPRRPRGAIGASGQRSHPSPRGARLFYHRQSPPRLIIYCMEGGSEGRASG